MTVSAQKRASDAYRRRLAAAGLKRFEVRAPARDQALIRQLADKLAKGDAEAERVRAELEKAAEHDDRPRGGIWAALRASPLVGADLDLSRDDWTPRDVEF
jgi:hypothetical protein